MVHIYFLYSHLFDVCLHIIELSSVKYMRIKVVQFRCTSASRICRYVSGDTTIAKLLVYFSWGCFDVKSEFMLNKTFG
jgi:hypothetical protein